MTTTISVVIEDDPGGGPADETVRFAIDGIGDGIDLDANNAATFRRKLAPYIEHTPRASRGHRPQPYHRRHCPAVPSRHGRIMTPA
jgi:hypothetical protein